VGVGYTRQSEANIVDEAVINADDFNAEFDQIESAFNATTGHTHDGTEGEGPKIDTAGLADGAVTTVKIEDDAVTGAKIDSTTTVTAASFVGPLTDTATALETARTIAGQSFDGTANITIAPTDLTGVTATASELNILDGATVTTTELNYLDGVTSNVQTQINNIDAGSVVNDGDQYSVAVYANAGPDNELTDGGDYFYVYLNRLLTGSRLGQNSVYMVEWPTVSDPLSKGYGSYSVVIGHDAGFELDAGADYNTFIGHDAGKNTADDGSAASASYNTFIGASAGLNHTGGKYNTFLGADAGENASDGDENTFIGISAGQYAGPASDCVFIGSSAGAGSSSSNVVGDKNVAIGYAALADGGTGGDNTVVGYAASTNGVGEQNTILGSSTAVSLSTGDNNTCVGYLAGYTASPLSLSTESNRVIVGNNAVTNAYIAVSWSVTSDERDKTDLENLSYGVDFLKLVEPKVFRFDRRSWYYEYDEEDPLKVIATPDPDGTLKSDNVYVGFSAQQVQEAVEQTGFPDQVLIDTSDPENYKMKETAFIAPLVQAVKELTARVEQLEAQLNSQ